MLTCRELTEVVTDYLEGHLSLWDRLRFQMHIGMCRHCRAYLRQMRATIGALATLNGEIVIPVVPDELLLRFRGWKKSGRA